MPDCPYDGEVWAPEHICAGQWDPRVKCGQLGQLCPMCIRDSNKPRTIICIEGSDLKESTILKLRNLLGIND